MYIIQRLRDLREDKDLNQKRIAEILNITQQQYSLYEKGQRKLPIDLLKKLCIFYNVSADYILGFTNTKKPLTKE